MRFKLGCSLAYEVMSPTTFIFNVEVARLRSLDVLSETLTLAPDPERRVEVTLDRENTSLAVEVRARTYAGDIVVRRA